MLLLSLRPSQHSSKRLTTTPSLEFVAGHCHHHATCSHWQAPFTRFVLAFVSCRTQTHRQMRPTSQHSKRRTSLHPHRCTLHLPPATVLPDTCLPHMRLCWHPPCMQDTDPPTVATNLTAQQEAHQPEPPQVCAIPASCHNATTRHLFASMRLCWPMLPACRTLTRRATCRVMC